MNFDLFRFIRKPKITSELFIRELEHTGCFDTLNHVVPNISEYLPWNSFERMKSHLQASLFEVQKFEPMASFSDLYGDDWADNEWVKPSLGSLYGKSEQEYQPNLVEEIFAVAFSNKYFISPEQRFLVSFGNNKIVVASGHHRYEGPEFAALTPEVHYLLGTTEASEIRIESIKRGSRLGPVR